MHVQPEGYIIGNRVIFESSVDVLTNISTGRSSLHVQRGYILGNRVTFDSSVDVLTTSVQVWSPLHVQQEIHSLGSRKLFRIASKRTQVRIITQT